MQTELLKVTGMTRAVVAIDDTREDSHSRGLT